MLHLIVENRKPNLGFDGNCQYFVVALLPDLKKELEEQMVTVFDYLYKLGK